MKTKYCPDVILPMGVSYEHVIIELREELAELKEKIQNTPVITMTMEQVNQMMDDRYNIVQRIHSTLQHRGVVIIKREE